MNAPFLSIAGAPFLALVQDAPLFDEGEWSLRDEEGRAVLVERELAEHGWKRADPLARWLEEHREAAVAEWVALAPPGEGGFARMQAVLARLEAASWARTVAWTLRHRDSHTAELAQRAFAVERPGYALDWLERHEAALDERARAVLARLRALDPPPAREDASTALPPWTEATLLPRLSALGDVEEFGDRRAAEPGAVYVHQLARELRIVAAAQLYSEPWLARLRAATAHARADVRALAWTALAEAKTDALPASAIPDADFLKAVDDEREDSRVRAAALAALSQRAEADPRAWFALHDCASRLDHPAWHVAVSRLGDVGDEMTIELLAALAPASDSARRLAEGSRARLAQRAGQASLGIAGSGVRAALERTAWIDSTCGPLEARRKEWTHVYFAPLRAHPDVARALAEIAAGYRPSEAFEASFDGLPRFAGAGERVRQWAQWIKAE